MILKIFLMSMITLGTLGELLPSTDTYLLGLAKYLPVLNTVNLFDGPGTISHAKTKPTVSTLPKMEQLLYYNFYAASMYCPYKLNNLSCEYCQEFKRDVVDYTVLTNNVHATCALVTVSKSREEIVVAYRGTMNVWNVVLDALLINASPNKSLVKVHFGFYKATQSLYNEVVETVETYRTDHPTYKIVIVGHSLGGAMARITEYLLLSSNRFPDATYEVYTYGEPRSGNKYYVDFLNKQRVTTARVVDRADIVPHLNPTSILGTTILFNYYLHVQTEYWINGAKGGFCNRSFYEDPNCSDSLGPLYSPVDHYSYFKVNYVTCTADQPLAILSLPFNILPVAAIPQIPKLLSNLLVALNKLGLSSILNLLGR